MTEIRMTVNGNAVCAQADEETTLLDFLREQLHLKGTKCGCERGECGACTVIMNGRAVDSCLIPICKADGAEVLTVEGLGTPGNLSMLQQAFIDAGAVQCGFCTPGMLMSAEALLRETPHPTDAEIREAISGNLCRCTGYTKIVDAIRVASEKREAKD